MENYSFNPTPENKWERIKKYITKKNLGFALLGGIVSVLLFYYAILFGFFGRLPHAKELSAIKNPVASEIYAENGELIGKFYIENRTQTDFDDISPFAIQALVATEDERFYQHEGVDLKSYGRVLFKTILGGDKSSGGGSTISQQLAKNLYPRKNYWILSMPVNKIKEAIVASRLEDVYSKNEILSLYLNTVSFGERAFGIATASQRFFSKKPSELNIEEAATLIGMLKATSTYSPRKNPEKSKNRRNVVLQQMAKSGYVSEDKLAEIQSRPLDLKYTKEEQIQQSAPYFKDVVRKEMLKWQKENLRDDGSSYNIYTDGLKIHTSINPTMQKYAEEAVQEHMAQLFKTFREQLNGGKPWGKDTKIISDAMYNSRRYKAMKSAGKSEEEIKKEFNTIRPMKVFSWNGGEAEVNISPLDSIMHYLYFMNAGFVVVEPSTGEVKAWVGGIDHNYFKVDHVTSKSQVGSTFKPLVYATALEEGISSCKFYANERRMYQDYDDWSPRNANNEYGGAYTLKGGLTHSVNTVSVQVLFDTGIKNIIALAEKMGVKNKVPEVPSIALGTAELSLLEMVGAYTTFSNNGISSSPNFIQKIENGKGQLIVDFSEENKKNNKEVLSSRNNEKMIEMMKSVVDEGTGRRLRFQFGLENEIAGKTGTTQNQTDGWFIGCTPKLVAGAWVGAEDKRIRFATTTQGQGARTALPIWGHFFKKLYADPIYANWADATFYPPKNNWAYQESCPLYSDVMPIENTNKPHGFFADLKHTFLGWTGKRNRTESLESKLLKEKAEKERELREEKKKKLREAKKKEDEEKKRKIEADKKARADKRKKKEEARNERNRKIKEKKERERLKRLEERKRKEEARKRKKNQRK